MSSKKPAQKKAKQSGFSEDEKAAMKERARELKAEARANSDRAAGESDLLAKVKEMKGSDRKWAEKIHAIMKDVAPSLWPKTWYGMPAYARDGKIVCFFQSAEKFKVRYATLGFTDLAKLDDGDMWPTYFALNDLTPAAEQRVRALIKQAVS